MAVGGTAVSGVPASNCYFLLIKRMFLYLLSHIKKNIMCMCMIVQKL